MRPSSLLASGFRLVSILVFGCALVAVLGAGTCTWDNDDDDARCFDDDDDNDAGCDDDDFDDDFESPASRTPWSPDGPQVDQAVAQLAAGESGSGWAVIDQGLLDPVPSEGVRLEQYELARRSRPGRHPVARLTGITGVEILEPEQPGVLRALDYARTARAVLDANDDLLGIPPEAGHLEVLSVHFLDSVVAVVAQQVPPGLDGSSASPGDGQSVLAFDLLGRLLQVDHGLRLPRGSTFVPARLATTRR